MKMHNVIMVLSVLLLLVVAGCTSTAKTTQTNKVDAAERIYNLDPQRKLIGQSVDDLHFKDILSGKTFHLDSDFKDRVVIIETFSIGCPACAEGINNYNKLYDKYGDDIQIIYMDINELDTKEAILDIKDQFNGRDWIWLDVQGSLLPFFDKFNIYANEQTFIINEGVIAYADSFKVPLSRIENVLNTLV